MQRQRASNWLAGHGSLPDADSITATEDGFGSPSIVSSLHKECMRIYGPPGMLAQTRGRRQMRLFPLGLLELSQSMLH
ncbi:hypothetical protein HDV57DRAFT_303051 [Trichoderma longibrachiatum]